MSRRLLLAALERAALEADPDAADEVLAATASWSRRRLRRRVASHVVAAREAVARDAPAADAVAARVHGLHLAWLAAAGRPWRPLAADAAAAAAAFYAATGRAAGVPDPDGAEAEATAAGPGSARRWRLFALTGLALVLVAVALGLALRAPPPLTEGPIGEALTAHLADWTVSLDRWAPLAQRGEAGAAAAKAELDTHRARVLGAEPAAALGPEATAALAALLEAASALASDPAAPGALGPRDEAFRAALRAANAALARADSPYFLDGDWLLHPEGYAQTALFTFGVHARRELVAAQTSAAPVQRVTALHLQRLDTLNWTWSKLGYTRKAMDVAVVLLDEVDEQLITYVGPALAPGADMPLVDPDDRDDAVAWQAAVQRAAGEVARATFARALSDDADALARLGAALEQRRASFGRWRVELSQAGYALRVPGTLALGDALYAALKEALPDFQVEALAEVQRELESGDARDLFARMSALHAAFVERHEVQHRLDYARGEAFPIPEPVARLVAAAAPDDSDALRAATERRRERLAYELSAYTSEIARAPAWARLGLTLLVRHALDRRGASIEAAVAAVLLDGLTEELRLGARIGDSGARRRKAAEAYLALLAVDEARLASAASSLWSRWFGAPLPPLSRPADAPEP